MTDLFEHDKFLFIAFEQGAGGHRLARQMAMEDDVYWYSDPGNGLTPNETALNEHSISRRKFAPNHFDRMVNGKMLPPLFNVIEPYYNDVNEYYPLFEKLFVERGGLEIMDGGQYLMYPVHVTKPKIKAKFPNAKIVEIIPDDIEKVVQHYLNTVSNFPAYLYMEDFRPNYLTPYAQKLEQNKNATIRELYDGNDYENHVRTTLTRLVQERVQNP